MSGTVFKILACLSLLFVPWASAAEWQLMPQIGVAETDSSDCEMTLSISPATDETDQELCAFIDDEKLMCWQDAPQPKTVSLSSDSWLFIRNADGAIVYSQKLLVKWQQSSKRRRVRDPWSLF